MVEFEAFRQHAVEAIRVAAAEACQTVDKDAIFGFALCTDDDVETIYHAYATRQWVADHEDGYPEIGFISVEWAQSSSDHLFLPLSQTLRVWAATDERRAPDFDAGRSMRFQALVEAMKLCRDEGLFDTHTLLCVGSTDPDGLMERLAGNAGRLLNNEAIATAYCRALGY